MEHGAAVLQERRTIPDCPHEAAHVWSMFADLSSARGHMVPISYSEIEAYGRLTGQQPSPWEVEQIKALDGLALRIWSEKATKKAPRDRAAGNDAVGIDRVLGRASRNG